MLLDAVAPPFCGLHRQARDASTPTIIGQTESIPRSYRIDGCRTHRWITSNVFALNRLALRELGGQVYRPALDG